MDQDGQGIGHTKEGYTLFIKDAVIGDQVTAKIMKAEPKYAFAKLVTVDKASPYRIEPKCDIANKCGGCQIQTLGYERQLKFKQDKVRNDLIRIGGFDADTVDAVMSPIVGMDDPFHYRNKEQVPIGTDKDGNPVCGFYAGRTHDIIPMTDCEIGAEDNRKILEAILDYMKLYEVSSYDEKTGEGLLRHVLIRNGIYSRETMVVLVVNGTKLPEEDKLVELLRVIPGVSSIILNTNTAQTNVVLGKKLRTLWGEDSIEDSLHVLEVKEEPEQTDGQAALSAAAGISADDGAETSENNKSERSKDKESKLQETAEELQNEVHGPRLSFLPTGKQILFRISPLSFYQVNPKQTEKLYSIALSYAGLTGSEYVLDLYCGIGTISLFMAQKAREVYGIEVVPEAVRDAKINAESNGIENVLFEPGRAEEVLPAFADRRKAEGRKNPVDVIVVDPPRKGLDDVTINTMLDLSPARIVYVSCDPATLARDLKKLCGSGYELTKAAPVDQFGHTVHVETVCLLSKLHEAKHHIEVKVDMDELDLTSAEAKATYKEIQDWVQEKYGFHVTNLNIAQVKQKHGIIERENYNKPKSSDSKQPGCPEEKVKAIEDAMRHFQMI